MGGEKLKQNSKMKTLRMFATTLMMVVLCLNFSACGDDDDKDAPSNYFTAEELVNLKSASNLNGNLNCSKELEHYAS